MGMDIPAESVPVNGSEVRGRTSSTEKNYSRDTSMSSTQSSVIYHERMANNSIVIVRRCGQTLGLELVDRVRTVIIISLQQT